MALTNAERQRRYRERKRAEQRRGGQAVTPAVTEAVTRDAVTPDVPDLGPRGRRLWLDTVDDGPEMSARERVVLEEACRAADRLDTLDRILRGDEDAWMRFRSLNDDGSIVSVVINNVLAEARQQQVALKALLAEFRTSRGGAPGKPPRRTGAGVSRTAPPVGKEGGGVVADLAAWVAGRGSTAAG